MYDLPLTILIGLACLLAAVRLGAMLILFVSTAVEDGMILSWVKDEGYPEWIRKPLYGCTVCMASVWGTALYICFLTVVLGSYGREIFSPVLLFLWPIYCMLLSGYMVQYEEKN